MKNKTQIEAIEYTYRPTLRPVHFSGMPSDLQWDYLEAPALEPMIAVRRGIPISKHPYGIISVNRRLSPEERDRLGMAVC